MTTATRRGDPAPSDAGNANTDDAPDALLEVEVEQVGDEPAEKDDDATLNLLREFGNPPEWRTMAKHPPETVHLSSIVLTKGRFLGSTLRQEYVRNLFLMSRSSEGYGSEQMVQVATRGEKKRPGAIRRFFGLGSKEASE